MFGQAWSEYEQVLQAAMEDAPENLRERLLHGCLAFFDFAVAGGPLAQRFANWLGLAAERLPETGVLTDERLRAGVQGVGAAAARLAQAQALLRASAEVAA